MVFGGRESGREGRKGRRCSYFLSFNLAATVPTNVLHLRDLDKEDRLRNEFSKKLNLQARILYYWYRFTHSHSCQISACLFPGMKYSRCVHAEHGVVSGGLSGSRSFVLQSVFSPPGGALLSGWERNAQRPNIKPLTALLPIRCSRKNTWSSYPLGIRIWIQVLGWINEPMLLNIFRNT